MSTVVVLFFLGGVIALLVVIARWVTKKMGD